jgi:Flp pilus assembly pilin Flp
MFISRFMPRPKALHFRSDTSGTAGIEFALIVPVAMALLYGAIEYSRAVTMARRFNLVTATLSDLIARDDYEDPSSMGGLQKAIETIWSPYDKKDLVLQVIVVRQAAATATKVPPLSNYVFWTWDFKIDPAASPAKTYTKCSAYAGLPAGMLSGGSSTVIVEATYKFKTLFGVQAPGIKAASSEWKSSSSHAPRNLCVGWGVANCTSTCEST